MADDEIDFDDLDLSLEDTPDETGKLGEDAIDEADDSFDNLDDLDDLDLGGTQADTNDDSDDLFKDLDDTVTKKEEKKPKKKNLLAKRWQWPIFIASIILAILNFIVFPASEMKKNKIERFNRLAHEQIEKENWPLAKQYLDQIFALEKKQDIEVQQLIADVSFAIAEQIRLDPKRANYIARYHNAQGLYQILLDARDEETKKPLLNKEKKFYVHYQIARCLFHQNLFNEARSAFEKLQDKIDQTKRQRLIDEKKGKVYTATNEVWPDEISAKYPLAKKRSDVLNYLGRANAKMDRLQESILWFKRYAPYAEHGVDQLKVWEKIAQGYFLDGDINSAINWYNRIAKEYTTYPQAKNALYELGNLLRKNKRYDEARDCLKRSMEIGKIDTEHNEKTLFLIGQTYLEQNNFKDASRIFQGKLATAIKFHDRPVGTAGALKQGEIFYKQSKYDKAYEHYKRIVKTRQFVFDNPFVPQKEIINILQQMSVKAFEDNQYKNSANIYRFMLKNFNIQRDFILNKLAESIVAQSKKGGTKYLVEAGLTYQRIPIEAPSSKLTKQAREKAADLFYDAQDWAKADKAYGDLLKIYPGDPQEARSSYRRGMALKHLLQLSEVAKDGTLIGGAEFYFKDTINRHTNALFAYQARYELGLLYAQRDDWSSARKTFNKIINDDLFTPRSQVWRDSLFELGRVEHFMNLPIPAIKHLLEAIERYPDDKRIFASRTFLGYSYFKLKKYADAREQLRQVVSSTPTTALDKDLQRYTSLTIADSYVREKNYTQALAEYRRAYNKYQRTADAPWINFQIARCLEHLNQPQQALVEYNKAHWLYKRSKKNNYQDLPDNLRKKYWIDQVDWTKNTKDWFEKQKNINNSFFGTL